MSWRKLALVVACLAAATAVLALFFADFTQPHYAGRSLETWIQIYADSRCAPGVVKGERGQRAQAAIRSIGTNAFPWLVKWLGEETRQSTGAESMKIYRLSLVGEERPALGPNPVIISHGFHPLLPSVPAKSPVGRLLGLAKPSPALQANFLCEALGEDAAPAIPLLTAMIEDTEHPYVALRAALALGKIGQPAFPYVTNLLANKNHELHLAATTALGHYLPWTVGTNACVPHLLTALGGRCGGVYFEAENALRQIAPEVLTNRPAQ